MLLISILLIVEILIILAIPFLKVQMLRYYLMTVSAQLKRLDRPAQQVIIKDTAKAAQVPEVIAAGAELSIALNIAPALDQWMA
jgi:hypothetical protein